MDHGLSTVFDGAATGVTVVDREGRFLSANDRYAEITGYSRAELLTLGARHVTHPEDLPATLSLASQLLAGAFQTAVVEKRYIRKDGDIRWVRDSATLAAADPGGPDTIVVITEDIHHCREIRQLAAACLDEEDRACGRIARHMHDGAAQLLSALSMELALVRNPGPATNSVQLVEESIHLAAQCTRHIRSLIYLLQPGPLLDQGLGPAVQSLAAGFADRCGIPVTARIGELPVIPAPVESILFRIVREWLCQLRPEHHPGLTISLEASDGSARLELLDPSDRSGADLADVRHRVTWIDARTEVATGPEGTRVTIWTPAGAPQGRSHQSQT